MTQEIGLKRTAYGKGNRSAASIKRFKQTLLNFDVIAQLNL